MLTDNKVLVALHLELFNLLERVNIEHALAIPEFPYLLQHHTFLASANGVCVVTRAQVLRREALALVQSVINGLQMMLCKRRISLVLSSLFPLLVYLMMI